MAARDPNLAQETARHVTAPEVDAPLRSEMDRLRAKADTLASAVRDLHREKMDAQLAGEYARAASLMSDLQQLNRRCNQANRAWLRLVVQAMNASTPSRATPDERS